MNPRGSKDEHDRPHPPRAPSTTVPGPEEMRKKDDDESSRSDGEEEFEDGRESHPTSASGRTSTDRQSDSRAIASPSDTINAREYIPNHRQRGAPSSAVLGAPPQPAPAQQCNRPEDSQTPPRGTSRGLEGDLQAGHVSRHHTTLGYHRRLGEARDEHAKHANEETSAALAQTRVEEDVSSRRPPPRQTPTRDPFGLSLNPPSQLSQPTQTLQTHPASGGHGSSMPAMAPFHREAAQLAFEQQVRRQQNTPSPDLPRTPRRTRAPNPAHQHPSGQPSQQPGQPSTQTPQDPTQPTRDPSRRELGDDEDQNGGQEALKGTARRALGDK